MKNINTTYQRLKSSKYVVTRIDGIIDGPDFFDTIEDVDEHIASEIEFNSDTDSESLSIESIKRYDNSRREQLSELLTQLELTYKDVAMITGHSADSIKTMLQPNKELPRWVNLVLYVWKNE